MEDTVFNRKMIGDAARWAIRASTNHGKEMDFDPDALVMNLIRALVGHTEHRTEYVVIEANSVGTKKQEMPAVEPSPTDNPPNSDKVSFLCDPKDPTAEYIHEFMEHVHAVFPDYKIMESEVMLDMILVPLKKEPHQREPFHVFESTLSICSMRLGAFTNFELNAEGVQFTIDRARLIHYLHEHLKSKGYIKT